MKKLIIILILFLSILQSIQSQTDSIIPKKIYRIWIDPMGNGRKMEGALFEVNDSAIRMSDSRKKKDYYLGTFDISKVDIRNIDIVKIRKKHRIWNGILIGGISGAVIGGVIGAITGGSKSSYDITGLGPDYQPTNGDIFIAAASVAAVTAGIGMLIGAAVGSHKTKIPIHGDQMLFNKEKRNLNDNAIKFNPKIGGSGLSSFSNLRDKVVDADGNVYHTIALGGQVWMAENLNVMHYRDGSEISSVTKNVNGEGSQYNWFSVSDSRKLCPASWHVPSFTEWTSLFNSLGGEAGAGSLMEEGFSTKRTVFQWWSSTEKDTAQAQSLYLNNETIGVMFSSTAKSTCLSVRCIRD